jgi:hypothetical protein
MPRLYTPSSVELWHCRRCWKVFDKYSNEETKLCSACIAEDNVVDTMMGLVVKGYHSSA